MRAAGILHDLAHAGIGAAIVQFDTLAGIAQAIFDTCGHVHIHLFDVPRPANRRAPLTALRPFDRKTSEVATPQTFAGSWQISYILQLSISAKFAEHAAMKRLLA